MSSRASPKGVSNSNYYLQTSTGAYILTLYEKRVERDGSALLSRADGASGARGAQMPDARSLRKGGKLTGMLNGRPAAILTFLDGVSLRRPTVEHLRQDRTRAGRASRGGRGFHA